MTIEYGTARKASNSFQEELVAFVRAHYEDVSDYVFVAFDYAIVYRKSGRSIIVTSTELH